MHHIFSLMQTVIFCTTIFGIAFIVAMALPDSKLPSCAAAVARWCAAAIKTAMEKKHR